MTPPGLEGGKSESSGAHGITRSDGNGHAGVIPSDPETSNTVPRRAQSIVDALRAGDTGRALELAEALLRLLTPKSLG